jgi:ATP citrate (pro-S)-lyase
VFPDGGAAAGGTAVGEIHPDGERTHAEDHIVRFDTGGATQRPAFRPFDATTRSFVYGLQPRAIQGCLISTIRADARRLLLRL